LKEKRRDKFGAKFSGAFFSTTKSRRKYTKKIYTEPVLVPLLLELEIDCGSHRTEDPAPESKGQYEQRHHEEHEASNGQNPSEIIEKLTPAVSFWK